MRTNGTPTPLGLATLVALVALGTVLASKVVISAMTSASRYIAAK